MDDFPTRRFIETMDYALAVLFGACIGGMVLYLWVGAIGYAVMLGALLGGFSGVCKLVGSQSKPKPELRRSEERP